MQIHSTNRLVLLVLFLLVALIPSGCASKPRSAAPSAGTPVVRVRVFEKIDRLTLSATEPPKFRVGDSGDLKTLGLPKSTPVQLVLTSEGWRAGGTQLGAGTLYLEPAALGTLSVNDAAYRGTYRLVSAPDRPGVFDVINDVDLESYLMGVLPKELFPNWHEETYKAQAVIARTYALWELHGEAPNDKADSFDLHPDERSQVYGGLSAETPKSIAAVDATRGQVVVYGPIGQEKIFCAYFSSCCGGSSLPVSDVFNLPTIPPLAAKNVGERCRASGKFKWGPLTIEKAELTRRIRAWGVKTGRKEADMGNLVSLTIAETTEFNRPRKFTITDDKGTTFTLSAEQTRVAINTDAKGGPTVFSGFFRPVDTPLAVQILDGHGWGHGVGMCQWCCQAQAAEGVGYDRIVLDAYPQSKLMAAY